jgi:WD40 repeat protein
VELGQHSGFILHLIFSSDGRQIISADSDKFIRIWDLRERIQLATLRGHREKIIGLDLSPDGRTLASSSTDRTLRLWNLATHREVGHFEMESEIYPIAFAPDGSALLLTQRGKTHAGPSTTVWRAPNLDEVYVTGNSSGFRIAGRTFPR